VAQTRRNAGIARRSWGSIRADAVCGGAGGRIPPQPSLRPHLGREAATSCLARGWLASTRGHHHGLGGLLRA
jgi:hypothetical protein